MKLLDTNVLMYAVGREHPLKARCARILSAVAAGSTEYCVDVEALQELLYVHASRGQRDLGLRVTADMQILFPTALPITRDDLSTAVQLMAKYEALLPRDAIHAAVVVNCRLEGIVTCDSDFDRLAEIRRLEP